MPVIATSSNRLSNVVKHEYMPELALCREKVTVNDAAQTYKVGTVLGATLVGGAATAVITGTGNGSIGTVTVGGTASTGVYTLRIVKAVANAGEFNVSAPNGAMIGTGTVGVAFNAGGLSFTLADGATDFVLGDTIAITVTGTLKYKKQDATATDGSAIARGLYIADVNGNSYDLSVAATTDTTVLALARGPALVSKSALIVGAGTSTQTQLDKVYADLKALNIQVETTV